MCVICNYTAMPSLTFTTEFFRSNESFGCRMGCFAYAREWNVAPWKGRKRAHSRVCTRSIKIYVHAESLFLPRLHRQQNAFRAALCDSFNTPLAIQILLDLVTSTNIYLKRGRASTNIGVVRQVAGWITKMLRMFGLGEGPPVEIGWGALQENGTESVDVSL